MSCPFKTLTVHAIKQYDVGNHQGAKEYTELALKSLQAIMAHPEPVSVEKPASAPETPKKRPSYVAWVFGTLIALGAIASWVMSSNTPQATSSSSPEDIPHAHR